VPTVFGALGFGCGIVGGMFAAENFSKPIADAAVLPMIRRWVLSAGEKAAQTPVGEAVSNAVEGVKTATSSAAELLGKMGIPELFRGNTAGMIAQNAAETGKSIVDSTSEVLSHNIMYFVVFIIAFVLITYIVRLIGLGVNKLFKLPIIRTANRLAGAALGAILGAAAIYVGLFLCMKLLPDVAVFTKENIEATLLAKYFIGWI